MLRVIAARALLRAADDADALMLMRCHFALRADAAICAIISLSCLIIADSGLFSPLSPMPLLHFRRADAADADSRAICFRRCHGAMLLDAAPLIAAMR